MEEVIKRCDYPIGRGDKVRPHGEIIEGGISTTFGWDGGTYEADLCVDHKETLRNCLEPFLNIARRKGSTTPTNARGRALMRAKGGRPFTTKDVRQWLQENGESVAPTGRIPNADIERYKVAHNLV